jgi:hypothetical protein
LGDFEKSGSEVPQGIALSSIAYGKQATRKGNLGGQPFPKPLFLLAKALFLQVTPQVQGFSFYVHFYVQLKLDF